jgi:DNA-binding MarR family transcriptional regulator
VTRWLNDDEQRTWRAFLTASRLLLDTLDRELQRDAGMPHAYYEILVRLSEADDRSLRMSELANATLSSRSRLSHAVARLEQAGWVQRQECATDRRGQVAVLTDLGFRALVEAAPGHVEGVRAHLLDPLSEVQRRQLGEISETLLAHLDPNLVGLAGCDLSVLPSQTISAAPPSADLAGNNNSRRRYAMPLPFKGGFRLG